MAPTGFKRDTNITFFPHAVTQVQNGSVSSMRNLMGGRYIGEECQKLSLGARVRVTQLPAESVDPYTTVSRPVCPEYPRFVAGG